MTKSWSNLKNMYFQFFLSYYFYVSLSPFFFFFFCWKTVILVFSFSNSFFEICNITNLRDWPDSISFSNLQVSQIWL